MPYQDKNRSFNRNRNSNRRNFNRGPRQMHKTTCSACGNEAEVPFKPKEGLPVYCKDCFVKKREESGSDFPKQKKRFNDKF